MVKLMRRRFFATVPEVSPGPTLIYELKSSTNTSSYDTGVKLFENPNSFTILCEAYFSNRNWSGTQSLFGLDTTTTFRLGRASSMNEYSEGIKAESGVGRYTAVVFNNPEDADTLKMNGILGRDSNTTKKTRRFAVRYDKISLKIECFSQLSNRHAPNTAWWSMDSAYTSNTTLKLNLSSAGSTINIFKVYNGLLTDTEINNFLDGVT